MTQPGDRLRRIAARVCDAAAMDRLIDPALADLRWEHADAVRHGRTWRSRWVRLVSYAALLKVMAWHGGERSMRLLHGWTPDDRRAIIRTVGLAGASVAAVTLLLTLPPLLRDVPSVRTWARSHTLTLVLSLVPQALPIAFPVGIVLGILYGFGQRDSRPRARAAVLLVATAMSIASFVVLSWIMPAASQWWRTSVAKSFGVTVDIRGANELTLSELGRVLNREEDERSAILPPNDVRYLARAYYTRWALVFTTFVLACFSIAVISQRRRGKLARGIAACTAIFGYYAVMYTAESFAGRGSLPVSAVAWLPNLVFAVLTAMLMAAGARRREDRALADVGRGD